MKRYVLFGAAAWLLLHCMAWAAAPVRGRAVGLEPIDAVLMEDHSGAFISWTQSGVMKRTVVHIDSHIDVEWVRPSELKQILSSKTSDSFGRIQLDPLHPEERSARPLSIMNFLYPAMMGGMVKDLYWVTPDSLMSGTRVLDRLKSHFVETLNKLSIDDLNSLRFQNGVIKGKIYGIPLTVCKLSDLPHFKEAVLLDIDVDYFDPPDLGKRLSIPSIWPEEFITVLMKKGMKAEIVTVCYSVKGGYLALEYRFLGEELAHILKDPKQSQSVPAKTRGYRKSGHLYRANGMYPEAEREFQKGLELSPNDAALHYGLGLLYDQWGRSDEASIEFDRAKAIDGAYGNTLLDNADYYFQKGLCGQALPLYEQALQKKPSNLGGLLAAGICSSKQGAPEKALKYYQTFLQKGAESYLVHINAGVIYDQLGQWENAEREYRRAVELNPELGKAYQNLGTLYANRGEMEKAIAAFEKAIENNPCFKEAQNNLGALYAQAGKYDEAIRLFNNAVRIDSRYAAAFSNLGRVYLIQQKLEDALRAFQQALSIDPKSASTRHSLGRVYLTMGRTQEAAKSYEKAISADRRFYPAYLDLAKILGEKQSELGRAVTLARKAIEINPTAEAYALLAWLYSAQGKDKEASEVIHRALQRHPNDESLLRFRETLRTK